jgi:hypothetical protein
VGSGNFVALVVGGLQTNIGMVSRCRECTIFQSVLSRVVWTHVGHGDLMLSLLNLGQRLLLTKIVLSKTLPVDEIVIIIIRLVLFEVLLVGKRIYIA